MSSWQRRAVVALCCLLLAAGLPLARPVAAASFPDLPTNGATATAITELAARGIVRGYDDGTFRPGTIVERRQMAATLVRALGWSGRTPNRDFPDRGTTDAELWTALRILADMNVVRGFPDGTVGPEQPLTRQQALSVIARAFVAAGIWPAKPASASPYSDVAPDHQGDVALYLDAVGTPPDTHGDQLGASRPADRGWYAEALWPAVRAQETSRGSTTSTAPPPAPAPSTPATSTAGAAPTLTTNFGVAAHFMWHSRAQTSAEIARIAGAGLRTVRFDLGWRWVEPNRKGAYDESVLQQLDWTLAQLDARGITPIVTVIETPAWARPAGTDIFTPPTNLQDYADMMRILAALRQSHRDDLGDLERAESGRVLGDRPERGAVHRPAATRLRRDQSGRAGGHGPRRGNRLRRPAVPQHDVRHRGGRLVRRPLDPPVHRRTRTIR